MDVESKQTIDEAIDRARDELLAPLLAELLALRGEIATWRALLGGGVSIVPVGLVKQ
jgi:hypothetical protein